MAESGLPGYSSVTWFGVYLPAGAPPALVKRIHDAFAKAVVAPDVAASLAKLGVEPAAPSTSAQFDAMVQADSKRWATVIRQHKIVLE
jgi:tripartite-type tricarboxylate transporter receptor subunit TctC